MRTTDRMSERVLIVAPIGADAANISSVLTRAGISARTCRDAVEAVTCIEAGASALLMTEEAVTLAHRAMLVRTFDAQPEWSDLPVLIITSAGSLERWATEAAIAFGARGNISLVARPLRAPTLVAAVRAAQRARRRQYELRDLLRERDALLGSLEKRVQERTAKLQELVAELESFSYSVSHDLRAPLRVMAGYAQIILEEHAKTLTPDVRNFVARIAKSAEKMDRLTQDVLAYTRLSRGDISLEPVDLNLAMRDLIDQYPELAAAEESIRVQPKLGSVIAHPPSLAQAFSNLIGNALKFARPQVEPRIEILSRSRGARLRIVVQDNGIGIERAHLKKIFRIFERVAGHDVPGTGIGLAIVKKAAERMSGAVGVTSVPGQGSAFWLELPKAGRIRPPS